MKTGYKSDNTDRGEFRVSDTTNDDLTGINENESIKTEMKTLQMRRFLDSNNDRGYQCQALTTLLCLPKFVDRILNQISQIDPKMIAKQRFKEVYDEEDFSKRVKKSIRLVDDHFSEKNAPFRNMAKQISVTINHLTRDYLALSDPLISTLFTTTHEPKAFALFKTVLKCFINNTRTKYLLTNCELVSDNGTIEQAVNDSFKKISKEVEILHYPVYFLISTFDRRKKETFEPLRDQRIKIGKKYYTAKIVGCRGVIYNMFFDKRTYAISAKKVIVYSGSNIKNVEYLIYERDEKD